MKPNTVGRAAEVSPPPGSVGQSAHFNKRRNPSGSGNGLLAGTRLWTLDGEIPVEFLAPGDRIVTRDVGMAVLRKVRTIDLQATGTVRIKAGALGHGRPDSDLVLPAAQRVLVRDWRARTLFGTSQALVPAGRLVDGQYVTRGAAEPMRLVQLVFDAPRILFADGLELESAEPPGMASVCG